MPEQRARAFSREDFEDLQNDGDLSPDALEEGELDEDYIPKRSPGKAYITLHPRYEMTVAVTFEPRKPRRDDRFIVKRPMCKYFPPSLLRIKRLVLYQLFQDERLR